MQRALACAVGFLKRYLMDETTHYGSRWFSVWVRHLPGEWEGVDTSVFENRETGLQPAERSVSVESFIFQWRSAVNR